MAKSSLKKTLDNKKAAAAMAAAASSAAPAVHANGQGGAKKDGRVMIGGHFHPAVQIAFKTLAVEKRVTALTLLGEAIDLLFEKHKKPSVAMLSATE